MIFKIPANFISTNYSLALFWFPLNTSEAEHCFMYTGYLYFSFWTIYVHVFCSFFNYRVYLNIFLRAFYRLYMCVLVAQLCPILCDPTRLLYLWDSPGKNAGVGCHFLLQGIFLTQGSNLGLLHCWQILYYLSHQGNPFIDYAY